ncbi:MAG: hypothetical protein GXY33_10825 [Phycisphaerae bacterium]|nr:hypothetical protein [Phycisphaerae bacterium]
MTQTATAVTRQAPPCPPILGPAADLLAIRTALDGQAVDRQTLTTAMERIQAKVRRLQRLGGRFGQVRLSSQAARLASHA